MKLRHFLPLLSLLVSPLLATGQTVADRLRELDRLRAEGIISEEVYDQQWNKVLEDAMKAPPAPLYPGVPRLSFPKPEMKWEILLAGTWLSFDVGTSEAEMLRGDVSVGYQLTNRFQVVVGGSHIDADIDEDHLEATGASVGLDFQLATPAAGIVPYLGVGASWLRYDIDGFGNDDDWAWEGRAGFRQYIGDRVVVKYQATYQSFNDLDLDGIAVTVGIGVRF
ncbi:MAG TPA: outer membrane beta-barrel protein [Opitutaceae bacterium]